VAAANSSSGNATNITSTGPRSIGPLLARDSTRLVPAQ
jgi:hypothetical protein